MFATALPEETAAATATIMLVEDEEVVRALINDVLRGTGFDVIEASCADEALAAVVAHEGRIDLLLTDLVMPGGGGRELAERVLRDRPDMRVLYMSGYTEEPVADLVGDGVEFLQKPFSIKELVAKMHELLELEAPAA
jgi:two-component system cell cycle sensor histidine kinase/response regulator CckA